MNARFASVLLLMVPAATPAATVELPPIAARIEAREQNPTGLQIGFWANYKMSTELVRDFGPRPVERVNFHKWSQYEKEPDRVGEFDFRNAFMWEKQAHLADSTVITNVNTFFTRRLNPQGMDSIPAHYEPDIKEPATRAAARKFLAAFVRELLAQTGTAWLALDYEMIWFALPTKPEIRAAYRAWFLESAALCREVAAEMGMSDRLKIGVIVNTDPYDTAGHSLGSSAEPGHQAQAWLLDCVAAADFLGIDTYAGGASGIVTPRHQFRAIRFWVEHYSADKPVLVTESGFSTAGEHGFREKGYHIRGTEAEQAEFFTTLFNGLAEARRAQDDPLGKIFGLCVWKYADRDSEGDPVERHFGLVRADGTKKPAHAVVAGAIRRIEADPVLRPTRPARPARDVLKDLSTGQPVKVGRRSGTDYDSLRLTFKPDAPGPWSLRLQATEKVALIVRVGDGPWLTNMPDAGTAPSLELPALQAGRAVELEVLITSAKYPLETDIGNVRLVANDSTTNTP